MKWYVLTEKRTSCGDSGSMGIAVCSAAENSREDLPGENQCRRGESSWEKKAQKSSGGG